MVEHGLHGGSAENSLLPAFASKPVVQAVKKK